MTGSSVTVDTQWALQGRTNSSVKVDTQWALYGESADREGSHVLACSVGALSSGNFTEVIGRFRTGTPEALPQVTVSYVSAGRPDGNYLALAIQDYGRPGSGRVGSAGALGRPADFTQYFCLPYQPLADAGAGYCDLYAALQSQCLPASSGPPLPVSVTASSLLAPAVSLMTTRTAALLLTGRPVCVLGAQHVGLADRLAFIDAVMALLPYGFRARMTAATWTRATNQNHRFRLFFSGAQRDAEEEPDNIVHWGRPEETVLTPEYDLAYDYESWLSVQPDRRVPALLSGLTRPRSLAHRQDVLEALDEILPRPRPGPVSPGLRLPVPQPEPAPVEEVVPAETADEQLLLDCARHLRNRSLPELSTVIGRLKSAAKAHVTPVQRERYRQLIASYRLLRHDEALGHLEADLRKALMKLAFPAPLGYEDFCLVEDGAGGMLPDAGLFQLIEKKGMADDRVKAITYWQLPAAEAERKLAKWYASGEVGLPGLVNLLALDSTRPRHARLVCDVTVDYLRKAGQPGDPAEIDRILRKHSYLGRRLQSIACGHDQYQVDALSSFLSAAYPNGLSREDLNHVMVSTEEPATLAFLVAVLLTLAHREDAPLVQKLYMHNSVRLMNLERHTKQEVATMIGLDQSRPASGAHRR
jgi:hypothetical protein